MSFKQLVDATMKHGNGVLAEKSPPGFKGTVKAMKKHGIAGTVKFYGCPGEETGMGKNHEK